MPSIHVNGTRLFYELYGEGEPLILVHGSSGDHLGWQAVASHLSRWFSVLTYDRRGHSQSERPGEGLRSDDEDDLAALMERLGLAPAHVAGNSFGASIALGLASRRPDLFRSLIVHEPPLIATAVEGAMMKELQAGIDKFADRLRSGDIEGGTRQIIEDLALGPGAWEPLPREVRQTLMDNALTWLNELEDPAWAELDLEALSGFGRPALLSEGDKSPPWFSPIVRRLAQVLTASHRHTFQGAGHVPHLTHPEDYVRVVLDFIR
jgi:pimeloyl-ACP methyl ester carboxylesterase